MVLIAEEALLKVLATTSASTENIESENLAKTCDRLIEHFERSARHGTPRSAKYAVKCIVKLLGSEKSEDLLKSIVKVVLKFFF